MAQIIPKAKKDGSMSYLVRVYNGRTQDDKVITKCKTVTPPAGMGKKKTEKWVQEQAVLFEQQVTNGLVLDSDMLLDDLRTSASSGCCRSASSFMRSGASSSRM